MAPLMRLSCISLYVAIKVLSTSAEVSGGGVRGDGKGEEPLFSSLLQSATRRQKRLRLSPTAADKLSKGSKGWEEVLVSRDVGEEGSAEALTKATPDQRACLEWPTKCHLSHPLFLAPDGEIICTVILFHSKSLDVNVWVVTQPIPFTAAQLRHKCFIFFFLYKTGGGKLGKKRPQHLCDSLPCGLWVWGRSRAP